MGIGMEYVERKNTAIPLETAVCTENIYCFSMEGMKPVPARSIFMASPFRGCTVFKSVFPHDSLSIGENYTK
ncbi:hypothetical protein IMSAGC013_01065 [Lachnospiraceae bacterium]|nr:hypothetical protein IMSAGC013_01065 [Lachnospiraceae bacterium]